MYKIGAGMDSHLSRSNVAIGLKRHSDRCVAAEIRSTKFEIRNKKKILSTKFETNSNVQSLKFKMGVPALNL